MRLFQSYPLIPRIEARSMCRCFTILIGCMVLAGCSKPGTEYPAIGQPALKLEIMPAAPQEIAGWQPSRSADGTEPLFLADGP